MARVLIGWEYGSGRGHLAVVVPVAKRLRDRGHEVAIALKDPQGARDLLEPLGLPVVRAPAVPLPRNPDRSLPDRTLADVFRTAKLIDVGKLTALAQAWRRVLAELRPDVVVCEFAPTLALAVLGERPLVSMGVGYVCPPGGGPLPPIRFWETEIPEQSRAHEAALADAVAQARAAIGLPPVEHVSSLYAGDAQVVCTYSELDTYAERRTGRAAGPPERVAYVAPKPKKGRAFFYLARDASTGALMDAIAASGVPAHGYIRDCTPEQRAELARPGVVLHERPQPLAELLPACPLLIHNGGIGTAEMALAFGVPQVLLPRHLEQQVNGMAVEKRLMTGKSLGAPSVVRDPQGAAAYIKRTAESPVVRDRAARLALKLRARGDPPAADAVVRAVEGQV